MVATSKLSTPEAPAPDAKRIISSGNGELDSKMGGGLPTGSLTLVEGGSGAGKSVLAQQIIWGSLQDHFSVALFTSENSVKSLTKQMSSLGLDILDFLLLRRLRIYPMELTRLKQDALYHLLQAIYAERKRDLIIVDSLTLAIAHSDMDEIVRFFETCKRLSAQGATIIVVLHSDAVGKDVLVRVRSMSDAHLQLRMEDDGKKLVKTLEVIKVRGGETNTGNIVGFDVEPGWGMRVVPISKVKG